MWNNSLCLCCLNLILPVIYFHNDFAEPTWEKSTPWRTHLYRNIYVKNFSMWINTFDKTHPSMENEGIWDLSCTVLLLWWIFRETSLHIAVRTLNLWFIWIWKVSSLISIEKSDFCLWEGTDRRKRRLFGKKSTWFVILRRQFILIRWITLIKMCKLRH